MTNLIDQIDAASLRDDVPAFRAGDTLRVHVRVVEGSRTRTQVFQGVVIARQGGGVRETFTIRKISFGVGVERTFPVHTPIIERIEVVTRGDVTIIPVVEERLVLTRQLYLREEIHIRRVERRETAEVPVETRKQVATIERLPADEDNPIPPTNPDQFPRKG